MANDDFAALDAMAARFRKGELNAAGQSRLGRFYICMSRAIGTSRQEVQAWNDWSAWAARWVQHAPKSAAAHLISARIPLNLAWSYRGNGYANTVNADDWAQFHEYNAVSRAYLQSHEDVAGGDPFWHEMNVLIALRESADDDEMLALVDRAAKAFPTTNHCTSLPWSTSRRPGVAARRRWKPSRGTRWPVHRRRSGPCATHGCTGRPPNIRPITSAQRSPIGR